MAQRLFGNVRLNFAHPDGQRRLVSRELGDYRLSLVEAGKHLVTGDRAIRRSYDPDSLKVIVPAAGAVRLEHAAGDATLGGGAACLYDPTQPYRLATSPDAVLLMLQIPRSPRSLSWLGQSGGCRRLSGERSLILAEWVQQLICSDDLTDEGAFADEIDRLFHERGSDGHFAPLAVLRRRIECFVRANLERPELTIAALAHSMGCTPRYIHRAFEAEHCTPSDYIWQARLARARNRLSSADGATRSISDIAFSVGFSSCSHFSRAFRARYDIAPSELRWRSRGPDA